MCNFTNFTCLQNITRKEEKAPGLLIFFLLTCCVWIIVANTFVFVCLLISRRALKHYVNLQLLSFSVTDMIVGFSAVPAVLTYYITTAFPYFGICFAISYGYLTAQTATIFHAFGICLHRFISIKYYAGQHDSCKSGMLKRLIFQLTIMWLLAAILVAAPLGSYAQFSQPLKECSLNSLLGNNYMKFLAIFNVILITPQVGMNVIYVYTLKFLLRKWSRIRGTMETQNISAITSSNDVYPNEMQMLVQEGPFEHINKTIISNRPQVNKIGKLTDDFKEIESVRNKRNVSSQRQRTLNINSTRKIQSNAGSQFYKPHADHLRDQRESYNEPSSASVHAKLVHKPNQHTRVNTEEKVKHESLLNRHRLTLNVNNISQASKPLCQFENKRSIGNKRQKNVLFTIGIILLLLDIFITPLNVLVVIELIHDGFLSRKVKMILMSMALMNSALNPLVYALRIKPFKAALKNNWSKFVAAFRA